MRDIARYELTRGNAEISRKLQPIYICQLLNMPYRDQYIYYSVQSPLSNSMSYVPLARFVM